jgi:uncharacterized membrane protein YvlD (DUF360 family)
LPKKKKPRRTLFLLEIGSPYLKNPILNHVISIIVNTFILLFLATIIPLMSGEFIGIVLFSIIYTIIEDIVKKNLTFKIFPLVIGTFGFVFLFINMLLFWVLWTSIFSDTITFVNEVSFATMVLAFTALRFPFSMLLKNLLRGVGL